MTDAHVEHAPPSAREGQHRSPFTNILETLCDSCVGAVGAGLVDEEGECVDLAFLPTRGMPAYSIKLCGAHFQLVMRDALANAKIPAALGRVHQLWVTADAFSYVISHLQDGYVLVLICRPGALAAVSERALRQVEVELAAEAGWDEQRPHLPYWRRVHVLVGKDGSPTALRYAQGFTPAGLRTWDTQLSVVSTASGLSNFERGFVVNTEAGEPLVIVREPSGFWYAAMEQIHTDGVRF